MQIALLIAYVECYFHTPTHTHTPGTLYTGKQSQLRQLQLGFDIIKYNLMQQLSGNWS